MMPTLGMMYRGGLDWGQMRGCYLKSGGLHPLMGLYYILPEGYFCCLKLF